MKDFSMWNRWTALTLIVLLVPILIVYALSILSRPPANLGVKNGRLALCPSSPNCVCTQAEDESHQIDPIRFTGPPAEAMAKLKQALLTLPRMDLVTEQDDYLHAECRSLIFRYPDDVEFWIDSENQTIHFRSASRLGHGDFGVNRARMETIRQAFAAAK
jgi:uncharacterized protein (DUF1499 family)